ncbi:MAG: M23 family metallopeptidase [Gammaproteobacteria bacterium]|nr:MAG: M23 family metallopeptidase [Gammaproteobacteria bacterium]
MMREASVAVCISLALMLPIFSGDAEAQELYKYRGTDGEWMYADRPPQDRRTVEIRALNAVQVQPTVTVFHRLVGREIRLFAQNDFYAPVEVELTLDELRNVTLPPPEQSLHFVLEPQSETLLLTFDALEYATSPVIAYHYRYLPGDPESRHQPDQPYRAPFAVANSHVISQVFPYATTHMTADAHYALDIVMPVGTHIYAARGGTVFEVASTNFRGGLDAAQDGAAANLIRILHEDGTYSVYAHLNWNTIRVNPGDIVERGEYIADSGNTGFSSGPHLHFAVIRNAGMQPMSVPITLEGPNRTAIVPKMGSTLTAY